MSIYRTFTSGSSTEWTARLVFMLTQIEEEYLIPFCEDYLLCDKIDSEAIKSLVVKAMSLDLPT